MLLSKLQLIAISQILFLLLVSNAFTFLYNRHLAKRIHSLIGKLKQLSQQTKKINDLVDTASISTATLSSTPSLETELSVLEQTLRSISLQKKTNKPFKTTHQRQLANELPEVPLVSVFQEDDTISQKNNNQNQETPTEVLSRDELDLSNTSRETIVYFDPKAEKPIKSLFSFSDQTTLAMPTQKHRMINHHSPLNMPAQIQPPQKNPSHPHIKQTFQPEKTTATIEEIQRLLEEINTIEDKSELKQAAQ